MREWTPGQWGLRVTMVLGILVALLSTGLLGEWPAWWLVVAVGALSLGYALLPEGPMGTVAMGLVLAWWGVAFREGPDPQALVAAVALLASHLAGVVAGYGPDGLAVDRATVLLWVRRGLLVLPLAPLAWLVGTVVRDQPEPGGIWVVGISAAVLSALAASVALTSGQET